MTIERKHSTLTTSLLGYLISLLLTLLAYLSVVNGYASGWKLTGIISIFAILQLIVQFKFFLHIGTAKSNRSNILILLSTCLVIGIVVFGSIWIMNNLNYHTGTPQQASDFIVKDELISK
jgi:cytochrome o ubiquinol oxidase operon protein cyoD